MAIKDQIEKDVKENKVMLYMKGTADSPQCGFSAAAVEILRATSRPFKAVDILANPQIRQELPDYSRWPTFPQIFIDGKLVGGCDILHELRDSGELEKILEEAFGK